MTKEHTEIITNYIDSLIEAYQNFPEVKEVLQLEKGKLLKKRMIHIIGIAANPSLLSVSNLIKMEFDPPEKREIKQKDLPEFNLKLDLSDLIQELDNFGAIANTLLLKDVKIKEKTHSVNPFDRQYKRNRK
jgi:hypothetical protein